MPSNTHTTDLPARSAQGSASCEPSASQLHAISRPVTPKLTSLDLLGMLGGPLLIFAITVMNGHGRIFWEDEILGWALLRDPSWHHMLRAWKLGADGGGIFFYVFARGWFHLFGEGVLAFRLFTATTFSLAFPMLWLSLRRFYSVGIVAFATYNTLFFSPPLTMHYMEGRFYGLLVLGTAAAFLLALRLDRVPDRTPPRWILVTFAVHLLLTGSHVLGVVYSAFLLLSVVLLDVLRGRRRLPLYLAGAAAWLILPLERTAIEATARVGKPHFWTTAPTLGQVLGAYSVFSPEIFTVLLLLLLGTAATLPRDLPGVRATVHRAVQQRLPLYVTAGCLLLVPIAFLLEGLVGTWLFTDRYLQPEALAVACLTAELVRWTFGSDRKTQPSRWSTLAVVVRSGFGVAFALLLLFWVFRHEAGYTPSVPDFTPQLTAHVPAGLPVVVEDAFTFTELMSRPAGQQRPYLFLLDWQYATSPAAPRMEVTQYNLMQNWQRAGYFATHIQQKASFLQNTPRFLIVSNSILGPSPKERPEVGNPLARQLARTPGYTVQPVFTLDRLDRDHQRDIVYLVCRDTCPDMPPQQPTKCVITRTGTTCTETPAA